MEMNKQETKVLLYTKKVKFKEVDARGVITRKEFPAFLCKYNGFVFDCTISNDCKENRLSKDMAKNDLKYPVVLNLGDRAEHDNYFIVKEAYTRKDGTKGTKKKICITGYIEISQGEFPPQDTLEDIVKEKEMVYQSHDNDEMPF